MPQDCESNRDNPPREPNAALRWYLNYFRVLMREDNLKPKELHNRYFLERIALGTLKDYLNGKIPAQPQPDTVTGFRLAWKQASAERAQEYRLYRTIESALGRRRLAGHGLDLYAGLYQFRRHGRFGLVKGTVEIKQHCKAGVPFHIHQHTQATDAAGECIETFRYSGSVHWLARNMSFLSVHNGEIRFCLFPRVPDPKLEPLVGMFLSEECDGNRNPFSGKLLLAHQDWCAENPGKIDDEKWLRQKLKNNGPQEGSGGGQNLLR